MEKKLIDYLQFYIGCEIKTATSAIPIPLTGVHIDVFSGIQDAVILNGNVTHSTKIDGIKLLLRPVEDMRQEEMKELWQFVFKRKFGENGHITFFSEPTVRSKPRWVLSSGVERLGIEIDGRIWMDSDLHELRHNAHQLTRWLLSKHFDIFDLIGSGIAEDRTKFPPYK